VPYASTDSYGTPTTSFFLFMVTEKSAAKEVTDAQLTMLKNKAMSDWLQNQISTTQVTVYLRNGKGTALDTETTAWINYEVQKLIKKRPSTTTTETATTTTEPTTTTPATTEPGTTAPTTESTTEPATSSTTTP